MEKARQISGSSSSGSTAKSALHEKCMEEIEVMKKKYELSKQNFRRLNLLYRITKLFDRRDVTWEEIMKSVAGMLAGHLNRTGSISVAIKLKGAEFFSANHNINSRAIMRLPIISWGRDIGMITIVAPKKIPEPVRFRREKTKVLLSDIAEIIAKNNEKILTREALWKSEKKFRLMIDSLQEGFWFIDKDQTTTMVNETIIQRLGYKAKEVIGRKFFDFLGHSSKTIYAKMLGMLDAKSKAEPAEIELAAKSGQKIPFILSISPLFDEYHALSGMLLSLIDLSEQKKMEEKIVNLYRYLGVINRKFSLITKLGKEISQKGKKEVYGEILSSAKLMLGADQSFLYAQEKNGDYALRQYLPKTVPLRDFPLKRIKLETMPKLKKGLERTGRYQGAENDELIAKLSLSKNTSYFLALSVAMDEKIFLILLLCFYQRGAVSGQELELMEIFTQHAARVVAKMNL